MARNIIIQADFRIEEDGFLPVTGLMSHQDLAADGFRVLALPRSSSMIVFEDIAEGNCLKGLLIAALFEVVLALGGYAIWHLLKPIL